MANYPTSLDTGVSLPIPSATDDTNSPSLSGLNGNQNDALIALETKLGITSSTPTAGMLLRSTTDGESTWDLPYPQSETFVGLTDTQTLTNKTIDAANNTITNLAGADLASQSITATQIANATITGAQIANNTITATNIASSFLNIIYPVGCIYTETTGVNPGTTFGFGTWVAFGGGRVLVGDGTSDETFTAGETGGESNHTLTIAEMPSHNHNPAEGNFIYNIYPTGTSYGLSSSGAINPNVAGATASTGGGGAHNNLQPYIVVYFWERTA